MRTSSPEKCPKWFNDYVDSMNQWAEQAQGAFRILHEQQKKLEERISALEKRG